MIKADKWRYFPLLFQLANRIGEKPVFKAMINPSFRRHSSKRNYTMLQSQPDTVPSFKYWQSYHVQH